MDLILHGNTHKVFPRRYLCDSEALICSIGDIARDCECSTHLCLKLVENPTRQELVEKSAAPVRVCRTLRYTFSSAPRTALERGL